MISTSIYDFASALRMELLLGGVELGEPKL